MCEWNHVGHPKVGLPLAKTIFDRAFAFKDEIGFTDEDFDKLQKLAKEYYTSIYWKGVGEIVKLKAEYKKAILEAQHQRKTPPWKEVRALVEKIYDAAKELDLGQVSIFERASEQIITPTPEYENKLYELLKREEAIIPPDC